MKWKKIDVEVMILSRLRHRARRYPVPSSPSTANDAVPFLIIFYHDIFLLHSRS